MSDTYVPTCTSFRLRYASETFGASPQDDSARSMFLRMKLGSVKSWVRRADRQASAPRLQRSHPPAVHLVKLDVPRKYLPGINYCCATETSIGRMRQNRIIMAPNIPRKAPDGFQIRVAFCEGNTKHARTAYPTALKLEYQPLDRPTE